MFHTPVKKTVHAAGLIAPNRAMGVRSFFTPRGAIAQSLDQNHPVLIAHTSQRELQSVALFLPLQLFAQRRLRGDDQNLAAFVNDLGATRFRPQEVNRALAALLQLHQRPKLDGLAGPELPDFQLLKCGDGGFRFPGLPGLATREVRGLQSARVILVLGLVLLMCGFGVRRLCSAGVAFQLRPQLSDNLFDERAFVHGQA